MNNITDNHTPDLSEVSSSVLFAELWNRFKARVTGRGKAYPINTDWKPPDRTTPPPQIKVVNKYIIPEKPEGLIGERVVYNEKYLKSLRSCLPLVPERGYFTITKAVLRDDGSVRVALYPNHNHSRDDDDTHVCLSDLKRYSKWDNADKTKIKDFIKVMGKHMGSRLHSRLYGLYSSYGIKYLEDVHEVTLCATRGVSAGTWAELQRVKEKYHEMKKASDGFGKNPDEHK